MNPESKLVLLVMQQAISNDKRQEIEKLVGSYRVNWERFRELTVYHELITFVYLAFKEHCFLFPPDLMQMLKNTYYHVLTRNQSMWQEFLRISDRFKGAGIDLLPIKGISLLEDLYVKNPVRPMVDIDVLVKEEDLKVAKNLFYSMDYHEELSGLREDYWLKTRCQIPFRINNDNCLGLVEMHFNFDYRRYKKAILPQLWKRTRAINIAEKKIKFLSPEDTLFSLVLHKRIFGKSLNLKYVLDLALLLKKYGSSFNWDYVLREARQYRIRTSLFFLLSSLESFDNKYIPPNIYKELYIPGYKKILISNHIKKYTFMDNIESESKIIYLKSHLLLYDNFWEPLNYILKAPKEQFAMFLNLAPYNKKTDFLYKNRLFYMPLKAAFMLDAKDKFSKIK